MTLKLISFFLVLPTMAFSAEDYCGKDNRQALVTAGYSLCSIQELCEAPIVKIQSRPIDVKNKKEATEIVEKMRSYGCKRVTLSPNPIIEKGEELIQYTVFSSECALTGGQTICQSFPDSKPVVLRNGKNLEGEQGLTALRLCRSKGLEKNHRKQSSASESLGTK